MNRTSKNRISWAEIVVALVLLGSILSFRALAQTDSGKPLDANSVTVLVEELKEVVSHSAHDKKDSVAIAERWKLRKDLAGKTKKDVINLLFEDVKFVIKDSGAQYQIYSIFSSYKQIPDELFSSKSQTQLSKTRRPALPSDIAAVAGQDSDGLINNPVIKARVKILLGDKYDSFMESFETLNPVAKKGTYLFSSGCLIHACSHLESAIAVNLNNNTIHAAIFRQDEKTRYFNEGAKATPKVIRDWANNLKRINNSTNNSKSIVPLGTPNVAVARVETALPRKLRSMVPVRGFIGGETHDSYLIRARKGQVLTAQLSWRPESDNRASLVVSESPDFTGELAKFGNDSNNDSRWVGTIPRTEDYYIYVMAHPSAYYTLKVSLRKPAVGRSFETRSTGHQ